MFYWKPLFSSKSMKTIKKLTFSRVVGFQGRSRSLGKSASPSCFFYSDKSTRNRTTMYIYIYIYICIHVHIWFRPHATEPFSKGSAMSGIIWNPLRERETLRQITNTYLRNWHQHWLFRTCQCYAIQLPMLRTTTAIRTVVQFPLIAQKGGASITQNCSQSSLDSVPSQYTSKRTQLKRLQAEVQLWENHESLQCKAAQSAFEHKQPHTGSIHGHNLFEKLDISIQGTEVYFWAWPMNLRPYCQANDAHNPACLKGSTRCKEREAGWTGKRGGGLRAQALLSHDSDALQLRKSAGPCLLRASGCGDRK